MEPFKFNTTATEIIPLAKLENNTGQVEGLPANPRKIDHGKLEKLKQSITDNPEYLQTNPLKVFALTAEGKAGKYVIIGGNMRLKALKALGYKDVPCMVISPDTPPEKLRAYTILDNSNYGQWDWEQLTKDWNIADIEDWGVDIPDDLNFGADEPEKEAEEDDFNDEDVDNAPTRTHRGELWQLGKHRLLVGDSTNAEDVELLMGGAQADLLLTDPPYNVNVTGKTKDKLKIENDKMGDTQFLDFLTAAFRNAADVMKPGAAYYIWHASMKTDQFAEAVRRARFEWASVIVWYKSHFTLGRQDYQWMHELCHYGWKTGAPHYFINDRTQCTVYDNTIDYKKMDKRELLKVIQELTRPTTVPTTVWREDKPVRSEMHPTMKPVKLFARSIRNSSRTGETVLDLFAGSGTAIIACEQLGRRCSSMEYDPRYADAILARWEKFTGQKAKRTTSPTCLKTSQTGRTATPTE